MTPADKKKLQDAFNAAVNASPFADDVVEGMRLRDGGEVTRRKLVELTLQAEEFYTQVDKMLAGGKITLDEFIHKFEEGMKRPNLGPKP